MLIRNSACLRRWPCAALVWSGLLLVTACGNEDRSALDLGNDTVITPLDDGGVSSSELDSDGETDTPGTTPDTTGQPVDVVHDGTIDDVFEDGSEGSSGGDAVAPAPDAVPEVTPADVSTCPTLTIACSTRAAGTLSSGVRHLITNFDDTPVCVGSGVDPNSAPSEIRWEYSYPGLQQTGSETIGTPSLPLTTFSVSPGPYELRYAVDYATLACKSEPFLINFEAPDGFYVEMSWNDGLRRDGVLASETDIDTHLVRDGACVTDPEGDLYFATRNERLDWGVVGDDRDNPRYLYDDQTSPGVETAWIEEPSTGQVVHYILHGFQLDDGLQGDPVDVRYRVFIDGNLVDSGLVSVGLDEYVAVGAFADGNWLASDLDDEGRCPVLVNP